MSRSCVLLLMIALTAQGCAALGAPTARLRFPSLADSGVTLDAYLFKPDGDTPRPAVVFLHGCGGLFSASTGHMQAREIDWAKRLVGLGYVVLMVDSFTSRGVKEMCSQQGFKLPVYLERPKDAYAALRYLQTQRFVRPDRIAAMGWSQGGGVILLALRADSLGRPPELAHDFRAAVAFYPASCHDRAHRLPWKGTVPTLVLIGDRDNWTPGEQCRAFVDAARSRGSEIELRMYPGAYHDFDWPDLAPQALTRYRMASGVVPVTGTDPAARADSITRVPEFLAKHLRD